MLEFPKISVMNLQPDDILIFSTPDKLSKESHSKLEKEINDWKKISNITNSHLILMSSLKLEILRPEDITIHPNNCA